MMLHFLCFAAECYIKHSDMETKMKNAGLLHVAFLPHTAAAVM